MTYCAAQSRVLGVEAGTPSIEAEIWVLAGAEVGPAFVGSLFAVIFKLIHVLVDEVYQVPFVRLRFGLFVQGGEAHVLAPAADIGSFLLASRARVASSAESTVRSWWSQHSQREDKADPGYVSSDMDTVTRTTYPTVDLPKTSKRYTGRLIAVYVIPFPFTSFLDILLPRHRYICFHMAQSGCCEVQPKPSLPETPISAPVTSRTFLRTAV
jgi:hypothetical protein